MTLAVVYSRAQVGLDAKPVSVEVHITRGMPGFSIVGLPETVVRESRHRVRSAILNANFSFPRQRITINLAPADLPKEGSRYDLPIALGILAASKQISLDSLQAYEFVGELALTGEIRSITGALPFAKACHLVGRGLILPEANAVEASMIADALLLPAVHLLEVCAHLQNKALIEPFTHRFEKTIVDDRTDFADIRGLSVAKRALEICAAGGHNLLMIGPPGTGKTMLATSLGSILPSLPPDIALEIAMVASLYGKSFGEGWPKRPFRAPHHSASCNAMVGGGNPPRPGEVSLAHLGVLFLDELPEFARSSLDALREPLEAGCITISRAAFQMTFPANFQLIAAMNPCPCGYYGYQNDKCHCSATRIQQYQSKVSGPLLDRIDLHIEVEPQPLGYLSTPDQHAENSAAVRTRVEAAQQVAKDRQGNLNAELTSTQLIQVANATHSDLQYVESAMKQLNLSARAFHRIIKIARTIADLDAAGSVSRKHLGEALSYRTALRRRF